MTTSSEKTELALCSISIVWLAKAIFSKYAPKFADKVKWDDLRKLGREERKIKIIEIKNQLKRDSPAFHNDLCGALNIIMIAAKSRKIKKYMTDLISGKGPVSSKFSHEALKKKLDDGQPREPVNIATWFCIHEEDMSNEANKIKQFALAEEQRYFNWTWYNITPPTLTKTEREALDDFEKSLKDIFKREKDDKRFPVKADRLSETKTYIRYCVSTGRDPIETFLARNGTIDRGNDPTANTFLVDHYFNCDMIRVAFPEVIESSRVAMLFAKHVLDSEITQEEPKVFLKAMRRFATEEDCNTLLEKAKNCNDLVKAIRLKAMRFTVAEDAEKAEIRRAAKDNKKRVQDGLPPLPRLRCEVFENDNLFTELRRSFSEAARRKELMDVFELVFRIDLYETGVQDYLSKELKDSTAPSKTYMLNMTPRNIRFVPKWQEVENQGHRDALRQIQKELELTNDLASVAIMNQKK